MKKYKTKQVEVRACRYSLETRDEIIEWLNDEGLDVQSTAIGDSGERYELENLRITLFSTTGVVYLGNWIIVGERFFSIHTDLYFHEHYE